MAKDFFQDIVPPENDDSRAIPIHHQRTQAHARTEQIPEPDSDDEVDVPPASGRSIRNINIEPRGRRPEFTGSMTPMTPIRSTKKLSRFFMWAIAVLAIIILCILALFLFRKTSVTLTPRAQTVTFDQNSQYTAYPIATAATGTLPYSVVTVDLTDSEPVATQGTEHADVKASGNITVFNDYSTSPVTLIKNTRFATPDGLIFRVPDQIVIPGKSGTTPGEVTVTVQADQAGANYNVGPIAKFTLPGLQHNAAMYNNIYAQSAAAFTGGFSGDRPAAAPGAMDSALAAVRDRLDSKAKDAVQSSATTTILSNLVKITYQDGPQTTQSNGSVLIHETAHVQIPEIANSDLASAVASSVGIDTANTPLNLVPGAGFGLTSNSASSTALGVDPLQLTLTGAAQLVWQVDPTAVAQALAGKSSAAFQTVTQGFPGIDKASAHIEPFWRSTFPGNAADITVVVEQPKSGN